MQRQKKIEPQKSQSAATTSAIASTATASPSLRCTFLCVEWLILIVFAALLAIGFPNALPLRHNIIALATLAACAALSLVFPAERPLWQRRIYVAADILILLPSRAFSSIDLDLLLYLFLVKTCFLLAQKEAIGVTIAAGIAWVSCVIFQLPEAIALVPERVEKLLADPQSLFFLNILAEVGGYIATSSFVILFSFVALAERRSRQKALALAREVETLATALERTRIARDIHDSLGHTLTTLDIQLELAQRLYQRDPHRAIEALNTAKCLAGQSLAEVRRSVSAMREENFDLNVALGMLVEQFQRAPRSGSLRDRRFQIDLQANIPTLPLPTRHQLYCIVREALTNVQKHSRATRVTVRGSATSEAVILAVTDNGVGFDLHSPNAGFGLRGMQERVQILGGEIKIESSLGRGTLIEVRIPRN